jgi:signal transduction histidine kinase
MSDTPEPARILVIDDMAELHTVFRKVLAGRPQRAELSRLAAEMLGAPAPVRHDASFVVDSALQGEEGLACVVRSLAEDRPYAMAFVDMRMPPGWDGLQTIEAIWRVDPDLEIVICTAYSDHTDAEIAARLGVTDQLLFLRKPFDAIEARQLARALAVKRQLRKDGRRLRAELERHVATRVRELATVGAQLALVSEQHAGLSARTTTLAGELDASLQVLSTAVREANQQAALPALAAEVARSVRGLRALATEKPGRAATDLNQLVHGVTELMRDGIGACATLVTHLGELPPAPCMRSEIELVLMGLVDNAVQAIEAVKHRTGRSGELTITTRYEGGFDVIAIRDTGEPIPDSVKSHLFEPFGGSRDGVRQGLGMAWSIVVDQHGGELAVESSDTYSTVLVRLPVEARPGQIVPTA